MVIGGEVAAWAAESLVEPERCGQGEQALGDPDPDPGQGPAAVLLQAELALEGVDNALDALADRAQIAVTGGLVTPVRALEAGAQITDLPVEAGPGKAFVANDGRAGQQPRRGVLEQLGRDLTLAKAWGARHQLTGIPSGAHSRYSLRPQYQREWAAQ
jgi:hypothetical protein